MNQVTRTPKSELDCQHEYVALGEPLEVGSAIKTQEPGGAEWFGQCVFSAADVSVVLVKAVDDLFGDTEVKPGDRIAYWFRA